MEESEGMGRLKPSRKPKVVSYKSLPIRIPWVHTALAYLFLDRFKAPGWAWGVVATVIALFWILSFIGLATQEQVNLFEDKSE